MKSKFYCALLAMCVVLFLGCKKENRDLKRLNAGNSLVGLWQFTFGTRTIYDSLNNITKIDTFIYVDVFGNPMTIFEEYTAGNKFFQFRNSTDDTLTISIYTQTGNEITVHLPNEDYIRTISRIDSSALELYQMSDIVIPKQKWTQRYIRK